MTMQGACRKTKMSGWMAGHAQRALLLMDPHEPGYFRTEKVLLAREFGLFQGVMYLAVC